MDLHKLFFLHTIKDVKQAYSFAVQGVTSNEQFKSFYRYVLHFIPLFLIHLVSPYFTCNRLLPGVLEAGLPNLHSLP